MTLVELLVGMVLTAIAMGVAVGQLVRVFDGHEHAVRTHQSLSSVRTAVEQFESDVESIRSPGRDTLLSSEAIGAAVKTSDPTNPVAGAVHDVIVATPTELWLRADVARTGAPGAAPTVECVGYVLTPEGLVRDVRRNWSTCTSTITREVVVPALPAIATGTPMPAQIFRYHVLERDQMSAQIASGNPEPCDRARWMSGSALFASRTSSRSNYNLRSLDKGDGASAAVDLPAIIAVEIDLRRFGPSSRSSASAFLRREVAIASRSEATYMMAICQDIDEQEAPI